MYPDRDIARSAAGMASALAFLASRGVHGFTEIKGFPDNWLWGDQRSLTGLGVEFKTQGINPFRMPNNTIEVLQYSAKDYADEGIGHLAEHLELTEDQVCALEWTDYRTGVPTGRHVLGRVGCTSSLMAISSTPWTVYVNPDEHLYLYPAGAVQTDVRAAVLAGEMTLGRGGHDDRTFSVLCPVPPARWQCIGTEWVWAGDGQEEPWVSALTDTLMPSTLAS